MTGNCYYWFSFSAGNAGVLDDATLWMHLLTASHWAALKNQDQDGKRVLDNEEGAIGWTTGAVICKEFLTKQLKKRYSDMVEAVRAAYKERIAKLTGWATAPNKSIW